MVHIKSLKLRGFKSVGATKTVQIDFPQGFSAIVGANGSGKSNILEAFSFVMGNGSAKSLRATNMKSMIFSGNKKKGIAPAKEALVQLVFDNKDRGLPIDSDVVTISRRVNLSGQGTYRINGSVTTRSMIRDLLNMAGMDSNSYNMVLQGNVYEVVNMTKIERRKLIERIAGITSFDEKKEQAQRELEKVESNLAQVRLLMNEVSTTLSELEKERDDALRYQSLLKRRDISINALKVVEIEDLEGELSKLKESLNGLSIEIHDMQDDIKAKSAVLDELRGKLSEVNDRISRAEGDDIRRLSKELDELKQVLSDSKSAIKYLENKRERDMSSMEKIKEKLVRLDKEKADVEDRVRALESKEAELSEASRSKKDVLKSLIDKLSSNDDRFKDLDGQKRALQEEHLNIRNEISTLKSELKRTNREISDARGLLSTLEKTLAHDQEIKSELGVKLSRLRADMSAGALSRSSSRNISETPAGIQKKIKRLESDLRVVKDMIDRKTERLYEIRSTIKVSRQFGKNSSKRAIDALLNAKDRGLIDGIHDTIGNLGTVSPEHALAMDIAAGGRVNYMVVQDRNVASQCIKFLKKNRLGRLSFIPLDAIRYREPERGEKYIDGVIGRAVDLIDFDIKYLPAFEFIFGRTFIVRDLEVGKRFGRGYRRVTLDGDVIEASNLMTGGSINKNNHVGSFQKSSEAELVALEQEIENLKQKERRLEKEIRDCQEKISDYYTNKIEMEKARSDFKEKIAKMEARLEELEGKINNTKEQVEKTKQRLGNLIDEKESLLEKLSSQEKVKAGMEKRLRDIITAIDKLPNATLKREITHVEGEIKKLDEELNATRLSLAREKAKLQEHFTSAINSENERLSELAREVEKNEQELSDEKQRHSEISKDVDNKKNALEEKSKELSVLVKERDGYLKEIGRISSHIRQLELECQSKELNRRAMDNKIKESSVLLKEMIDALPEDLDVPEKYLEKGKDELKKDIKEIERAIEEMGNVNMMAIEKYNESKARFDDLTMRHEVLIKERESILEFMENIEKQKKTAFMQTFQGIARNFSYIFSQLSPGGEAKLELENLDDPFSGGVLIMARPAGKPLNEISLLSGGEKSLTSLSLIFAIQQYQPSPLYILDEIDAALDDANASRVAELIKELSSRSQFIIVTHRDVTMMKADQILGVTNVDGCTEVMNLDLSQISKIIAEIEA
ncbi:MAG: chromosome segregation protein SMC [Promethearchaeota archaeon]